MKNIYFKSIAITFLALGMLSCGGTSDLDSTESPVFITVEVLLYNPDIAVCGRNFDMEMTSLEVKSTLKNPNGTTSANQNVVISRWIVSPYRTDGGTVASPEWVHDMTVDVPSGGSASLSNYRIYPWEYLNDLPLSNLFPENGGVDPETGNTNIRQSFKLQLFGKTVSGHDVASIPINIPFNFVCQFE